MRTRPGKNSSGQEDRNVNDRKLTWADFSDDEMSRALGIRLTYSKWRRKLKGEKEIVKDENTPTADSQIEAGLKALDGKGELDVTTLVVKKKKRPECKPEEEEEADLCPMELTADSVLTSSPQAAVDDSGELSQADLNLLVTTLSRLTHRLAVNATPPPPAEESLPLPSTEEPFQRASFPPPIPGGGFWPSSDFCAPPPADYYGTTLLPHWPSDDYTFVGPQNLTAWRQLLTTLAHADPATLAAQLQSGVLAPQQQPNHQLAPEEQAQQEPFTKFARRLSSQQQPQQQQPPPPKVNSVRRPPSEGRFKQIARGKSTPEYLQYIRAIPKETRQLGLDPVTPRVDGTSWREFQAEVRAWKISLHRKSEALNRIEMDRCGGIFTGVALAAPAVPENLAHHEQTAPCPQGCT